MAVIDRLNGLGPIETGTTGSARKVNTDSQVETGGFELPADDGGVIYEPETERREKPKTLSQVREEIAAEEAESARKNIHSRFDGPGVYVELSSESVKAAEKSETTGGSILDIFRSAFESIRKFISSFWNGDQNKETSSRGEDETEFAKAVAIPENSDNIQENAAEFMVDYGGRHLAKNSDLLTQYDRTGHKITPSATDRRRILQGEGSIRKY